MTELSPLWLQGISEFNRREYYACHDTLEALWMEAVDPDKKFYQGVLQIAVGCYHLHNHNWKGAVILLGEGIGRLPYYQPVYEGINVSSLIKNSTDLLFKLQAIDPDQVINFVTQCQDRSTLPVIELVSGDISTAKYQL